METTDTYTAFENTELIAQGALKEVVTKVKRKFDKHPESQFTIFSDSTGKTMDFNLQIPEAEVLRRLEVFISYSEDKAKKSEGPGRPKLGVVSREVSLLPRHWEWLATQPGGASVTIRKLIEDAKKKSSPESDVKLSQERTYKFMSVMAGDLKGFEEALRALYRKNKKAFVSEMDTWPADVKAHALELAGPVFSA